MNLKQLEKELDKILNLEGMPEEYFAVKTTLKDIKRAGEQRREWRKKKILELIRRVVESVPVEEKRNEEGRR